ncbi:MAG: phosphatase PAP2 family protein [Variovorax sp.]|nr:phosphatase PAP2 family protein [Variovorax sp.]
MERPDSALFLLMTAGATPSAWFVFVSASIAEYGSWLAGAVMAWAAVREPIERRYLFAVLAMAGITSMLAHALADAFGLQRPFALGLAPAHISKGASGALPSAHAAVMGFVAGALFIRTRLRRYAAAALMVALLTGWARVHVAVHFPLDILAGFALSALSLGMFVAATWLFDRLVAPAFVRIQQAPLVRSTGSCGTEPPGVRPRVDPDRSGQRARKTCFRPELLSPTPPVLPGASDRHGVMKSVS